MSAGQVSIKEISDPYSIFMRNPVSTGTCRICRTFVDGGWATCYPCGQEQPECADVVVPITYSPHGGQMHLALRGYKDNWSKANRNRWTRDLAAVLWRFLLTHEPHVAHAAGVDAFDVVTVVPSKSTESDEARPRLRFIVGTLCDATADRFERLLTPTDQGSTERRFDRDRYVSDPSVEGQRVLLIDDTWTRGGSVQSAASALRMAGAASVGVVAIGRHIDPTFKDHRERYEALAAPFSWDECVME
jgi:predicted amidophosphoribosyltransferase